MKVTDLNWDELQTLIREAVHEELRDLITDPDWGPASRRDPGTAPSVPGLQRPHPVRRSEKKAETRVTRQLHFTPQAPEDLCHLTAAIARRISNKIQWARRA